jgi:hypothetical protein
MSWLFSQALVAARMDRLKAIGNGQVPLCAATAFNLLKARLT